MRTNEHNEHVVQPVIPNGKIAISVEQLMSIAPYINPSIPFISKKSAETFLPYILQHQGDVNTPLRFAAFLANILHESGCLKWVRELASGEAYEGRKDLGNIQKGDGKLFKGRGLIQVTGRDNYMRLSKAWYGDDTLIRNPDIIATPENAVRSAYWFWHEKKLNALADAPNFAKVVKVINGGTNGMEERLKYYKSAIKILS